jgi:hypothetical protein
LPLNALALSIVAVQQKTPNTIGRTLAAVGAVVRWYFQDLGLCLLALFAMAVAAATGLALGRYVGSVLGLDETSVEYAAAGLFIVTLAVVWLAYERWWRWRFFRSSGQRGKGGNRPSGAKLADLGRKPESGCWRETARSNGSTLDLFGRH